MPGYWKTKLDYKENLGKVACMDVDAAWRILAGQREALERRGQWKLAEEYVTPILQIALEMQLKGIRVDEGELDRLYGDGGSPGVLVQQRDLQRLLLPTWGGVGTEGQHQKVMDYLYGSLGLPTQKNRGTGKRTADSAAVEYLSGLLNQNHPQVKHLDDASTPRHYPSSP